MVDLGASQRRGSISLRAADLPPALLARRYVLFRHDLLVVLNHQDLLPLGLIQVIPLGVTIRILLFFLLIDPLEFLRFRPFPLGLKIALYFLLRSLLGRELVD